MSALMASDDLLKLSSILLGPLEIRPETVVTFPAGLPGFRSLHRFALVETQREELVWLQSVDDPDLTFLLADPFVLVPGFEVEIPSPDLTALGAAEESDALLVLVVVQLEAGVPVAANLQSPIIIARHRSEGRQVVLPDSKYGMQYPVCVD